MTVGMCWSPLSVPPASAVGQDSGCAAFSPVAIGPLVELGFSETENLRFVRWSRYATALQHIESTVALYCVRQSYLAHVTFTIRDERISPGETVSARRLVDRLLDNWFAGSDLQQRELREAVKSCLESFSRHEQCRSGAEDPLTNVSWRGKSITVRFPTRF
jgi:hypothetical protein